MLSFESDYTEGAHPAILEKFIETNMDQQSGYGVDVYSESARKKIAKACGKEDADIYFITGGTQTNQLVIDTMLKPYEGVVAAVTGHVAAHEAGHAVQYDVGYAPIKIRGALIPVTQFGSTVSIPLLIIGLLFPAYGWLVTAGIILFSFSVLFQLVTLPVEFNASRRAIEILDKTGLLYDEELKGARKVLSAAALTYLAAMITAVLTLLRLIFIFGRRND